MSEAFIRTSTPQNRHWSKIWPPFCIFLLIAGKNGKSAKIPVNFLQKLNNSFLFAFVFAHTRHSERMSTQKRDGDSKPFTRTVKRLSKHDIKPFENLRENNKNKKCKQNRASFLLLNKFYSRRTMAPVTVCLSRYRLLLSLSFVLLLCLGWKTSCNLIIEQVVMCLVFSWMRSAPAQLLLVQFESIFILLLLFDLCNSYFQLR